MFEPMLDTPWVSSNPESTEAMLSHPLDNIARYIEAYHDYVAALDPLNMNSSLQETCTAMNRANQSIRGALETISGVTSVQEVNTNCHFSVLQTAITELLTRTHRAEPGQAKERMIAMHAPSVIYAANLISMELALHALEGSPVSSKN